MKKVSNAMFNINYHCNIIAISCIEWNLLLIFCNEKINFGRTCDASNEILSLNYVIMIAFKNHMLTTNGFWLHLQQFFFFFLFFVSANISLSVCLSVLFYFCKSIFLYVSFSFYIYYFCLSISRTAQHFLIALAFLPFYLCFFRSFFLSLFLSFFRSFFLSFFRSFFLSLFLSFLNPNTFFLGRLPTPSIGSL